MFTSVVEEAVVVVGVLQREDGVLDELVQAGDVSREVGGDVEVHVGFLLCFAIMYYLSLYLEYPLVRILRP